MTHVEFVLPGQILSSLSSQRPSFVSKLTVGSVVAMDSGPMEMSRDPENVNEFDDLEE